MPEHLADQQARNSAQCAALDDGKPVHATTVARGSFAALLRGPSGSGKSDLALRFLCLNTIHLLSPVSAAPSPTHRLIADDWTLIARSGDQLTVSCPPAIAGRLEVRGLGIVEIDALASARLALVVDLAASGTIERMPNPEASTIVRGIAIPHLHLAPFEQSTPIKLAFALDQAARRLQTKP